MSVSVDAKASAALSVCESLLLCLIDLKVLREDDVAALLWDAVAAHRRMAVEVEGDEAAVHLATAELIAAIVSGGDSVRRRGGS